MKNKKNVSESFETAWEELTRTVGECILSFNGLDAMTVIRGNNPDLSPAAEFAAWAILQGFHDAIGQCGDSPFDVGEVKTDV